MQTLAIAVYTRARKRTHAWDRHSTSDPFDCSECRTRVAAMNHACQRFRDSVNTAGCTRLVPAHFGHRHSDPDVLPTTENSASSRGIKRWQSSCAGAFTTTPGFQLETVAAASYAGDSRNGHRVHDRCDCRKTATLRQTCCVLVFKEGHGSPAPQRMRGGR